MRAQRVGYLVERRLKGPFQRLCGAEPQAKVLHSNGPCVMRAALRLTGRERSKLVEAGNEKAGEEPDHQAQGQPNASVVGEAVIAGAKDHGIGLLFVGGDESGASGEGFGQQEWGGGDLDRLSWLQGNRRRYRCRCVIRH